MRNVLALDLSGPMVRDELKRIMGIAAEPLFTRVFRWPRANPQYDVGHLERVREMHRLAGMRPGLFLAGGSFEGVGLPDCVRQGTEAARKALGYLAETTAALRV